MSEQAHVNPFSVNAIGLMAPINDDLEGVKKRIVEHLKRQWPLHSVTEDKLKWGTANGFVSGSMPHEQKWCDSCGKDEMKCRISRLSCCPECNCRPCHPNTSEEAF